MAASFTKAVTAVVVRDLAALPTKSVTEAQEKGLPVRSAADVYAQFGREPPAKFASVGLAGKLMKAAATGGGDAAAASSSSAAGAGGAVPVAGQAFLFTGFRSAELIAGVVGRGGTVVEAMTKAVTAVVVADASSGSKKVQEAAKRGLPVYTRDQLEAAVGM